MKKATIDNVRTPLISTYSNVCFKLEFLHVGRSHKYRAAVGILDNAESCGQLIRHSGQTIIEKTGGNFGVGLTIEGLKRGYNVDLAVGLKYSDKKKELLTSLGANLIGKDMLSEGCDPEDVVKEYLTNDRHNKNYVYLNQFTHPGSYLGQYNSLCPELHDQLLQEGIDTSHNISFILGVGTGASASAMYNYFKEKNFNCELLVVEPEGSSFENKQYGDHCIDGISVREPTLLDLKDVDDYITVTEKQVFAGKEALLRNFGFHVGLSSAANFAAVSKYLKNERLHNKHVVVSLLYDRGEDY